MNINDLQNAELIARTKFVRFRDEFNAEWNKPNVDMLKAQMWKEIHPAVKAELAKKIPDVVKRMNQRFGG
jgi:hypothetical protein